LGRATARNWPAAGFTLAFIAFLVTVSYLDASYKSGAREEVTRVVYIDPLNADDPGFHGEAMEIFSRERYVFDAVLGEDVTVEYLRRLPPGYDLVILRVHSTVNGDMVWFFTGEEYSPERYVLEQLADEVHPARPSMGSRRLFAVGADYVNHFLKDRFKSSTVLVMGCDGARATDLAQAFIDNGAELYISWDGPVSLSHTDQAFTCLLAAIVRDGMSAEEAVAHAMKAVGPDPDYNSNLACFHR
jgi:hypothetical protein